jgi:hypothetical protein
MPGMCTKCDGFGERLNLATAREYLDIVRQVIEIVGEGTFRLVHADCPLEDLFKPTWPGDVISHDFQCTNCGRSFHLFADTYHGNASWTVD